jgi:ribonuclease HII
MARSTDKTAGPPWPDIRFELELWQTGKLIVAGVDEAGRGAWAGPVTAGAVILPSTQPDIQKVLYGVRDSKLMTARQRDYWSDLIREIAIACSSGWASCEEIDSQGILPATRLAMKRAIEGLGQPVDHLLIDAVKLSVVEVPQTSLVKGDMRVMSIAAASIIAKTERDHHMKLLEEKNPGYGFQFHKGYGTQKHRDALERMGISDQHRKSYAPVKALI